MFFIDGHCDTLSKALDEKKGLSNNDLQFSLDKADKLGGGIQIMASFVDSKYVGSKQGGFNRCNNILDKFNDSERVVKDKDSLRSSLKSTKTKVLLSIENGAAISNNIENVCYFYDRGVRMMSITWNDDNELGSGAKTKDDKGLTDLGVEYVKRLERLGIILDVSHVSEKSFWDAISNTSKPIVASHSNVYELCKNTRNLKDKQIVAIAKSGGIIGICYYSEFLNNSKRADLADIVEHIKYIRNLVGIDYVGLGSDFDGMDANKTASGVEDMSKIGNIIKELKKQSFTDEDIGKVMWKNWYNVLYQNLK
jgi:membrane dipeptidase